MEPVFIRHKLSQDEGIIKKLWDQRLIAIGFKNIPSVDPKDYEGSGDKSGANALRRLLHFCKHGALVGAVYRRIKPGHILIGKIEPGSKVRAKDFSQTNGDECWLKTVQLSDCKEVSLLDYPVLMGLQPRNATVCGWPSAEKPLKAAYQGDGVPLEVKSLHHTQLETLCLNYMIECKRIAALLSPIGGIMVDADIVGLDSNGQRVVAQVTHSMDQQTVETKVERLAEYRSDAHRLIIFAPDDILRKMDAKCGELIERVPIEEVFDVAMEKKLSPLGQALLGMLGHYSG